MRRGDRVIVDGSTRLCRLSLFALSIGGCSPEPKTADPPPCVADCNDDPCVDAGFCECSPDAEPKPPPQCIADCSGRTCGDDGCGGQCGVCEVTKMCTKAGLCAAWWRGNTHAHSTASDGVSAREQVVARYVSLGYDFLALTDHHVLSSGFGLAHTNQTFTAIDGEEVGTNVCHVTSLAAAAHVEPGSSVEATIDGVSAAGGVAILNHPAWTALPLDVTDLWPVERLLLMEVHNAITDRGLEQPLWDALLTSGKRILGVAADDCHDPVTGAGKAWIMVRSPSLARQDLLEALLAGDFYASTGVALFDVVPAADRLTVTAAYGDLIEFIGQGGRVLQVTTGRSAEYVYRGFERYVRARITSGTGQAWTQPVFLDGFSRDPYADRVADTNVADPSTLTPLLGPPFPGKVPANWQKHAVRLVAGQFVVLDMGEGEAIRDVPGNDLYVEEVDSEDGPFGRDPYGVEVSEDGVTFVRLGDGLGDGGFDLGDAGVREARFVRLSVASGDAEFDGVMFLDPALRDAHADVIVEAEGVTGGQTPNLLGPPFPGQVPRDWPMYAVQIGTGGHIVVDMGAGEEILDKPGPDLTIEEVDTEDGVGARDAYVASASLDGASFVPLGIGSGDASFDLAAAALSQARYLRIDATGDDVELDGITGL